MRSLVFGFSRLLPDRQGTFLRQIDRETPKAKQLHLVCDNYATHKPPVQAWLEKHLRFHIHFTPTSTSWLNMVERFFRSISTDRLERGVFKGTSRVFPN